MSNTDLSKKNTARAAIARGVYGVCGAYGGEQFFNCPFSGVFTALATPFKNGKPDVDVLEKLISAQLAARVDGLVLFGSTGEHFSLTESEKKLLFFTAKELVGTKTPLICGVGAPCTKTALTEALIFKSYGADGLLLLPPFYYECADNGLIAHFLSITSAAKLPTIIYNVPARTGVDIYAKPAVLAALKNAEYAVCVKQAEKDMQKSVASIKNSPLPIVCGCDELALPAYKAGAIGVISVASNIVPKQIKEIYELFFSGETDEARKKDQKLKPLYGALCIKSNPIPLKYAISKTYGGSGELRLPLTELSDDDKLLVDDALKTCAKNEVNK